MRTILITALLLASQFVHSQSVGKCRADALAWLEGTNAAEQFTLSYTELELRIQEMNTCLRIDNPIAPDAKQASVRDLMELMEHQVDYLNVKSQYAEAAMQREADFINENHLGEKFAAFTYTAEPHATHH